MKNDPRHQHAKTVAATAILTLAVFAGTAKAEVQIYGTVDANVGTLAVQPPGAPNAPITETSGVHSGGLQTSYFGIKATEELGDGLSAKFQLEGFFRPDTGQLGRFDSTPTSAADYFWSRETFAGLAGAFGEIRLGANVNPAWLTLIMTNAMGSNSVFSPAFRQLYNGGTRGLSEVDTALVNSVRYVTPNFGGLELSAAISSGEGRGDNNYAVNAIYKNGPLLLSAATQHVGHAAPPNSTALLVAPFAPLSTNRDQTLNMVGGAYSFGPVRVFAQYTRVENARTGTTDTLPNGGISAKIGSGELQFAYGEDETTGSTSAKRTTTTVGYVHSLPKRIDLYTFAMADKVSVGTANSFVAGIRYRF